MCFLLKLECAQDFVYWNRCALLANLFNSLRSLGFSLFPFEEESSSTGHGLCFPLIWQGYDWTPWRPKGARQCTPLESEPHTPSAWVWWSELFWYWSPCCASRLFCVAIRWSRGGAIFTWINFPSTPDSPLGSASSSRERSFLPVCRVPQVFDPSAFHFFSTWLVEKIPA